MTRHSFIQMSKLSNVKGRISYVTSPARQENLYATYHTADATFWTSLARENQQEFKRSGTEGKCIEAREFIIALPEEFTDYDPQRLLAEFTEEFRRRYDVECVSGLHHNKAKTNYHIHLIFSERQLLPEPEVKIANRSIKNIVGHIPGSFWNNYTCYAIKSKGSIKGNNAHGCSLYVIR